MSKRIAIFSDAHGCPDELKELYKLIQQENVDEVWHCGDLLDRGPESGAVVDFCRENNIKGIMGNHEKSILEIYSRSILTGDKKLIKSKNSDKIRTIESILNSRDPEANWEYLRNLPHMHVFDDLQLVLVHGGMLPYRPFHAQPPELVMRLQLIHPDVKGETRWFTVDRKGIKEEVHRANGWLRWYEVYDNTYDLVFGHTVFKKPLIYKNEFSGTIYGIDTGGVFGGKHTALIYPDIKWLQVDGKNYFERDIFEE